MYIVLVFLVIGAVCDIRSRSIPWLLYAVFGTVGVGMFFMSGSEDYMEAAFGILLGIVFVGVSLISGGKLGMGDGLAVLIMGIYLGGSRTAEAMLYAMLISAVISIAILALRKGNKDTALPFVPFLLTGCLVQTIGGGL